MSKWQWELTCLNIMLCGAEICINVYAYIHKYATTSSVLKTIVSSVLLIYLRLPIDVLLN